MKHTIKIQQVQPIAKGKYSSYWYDGTIVKIFLDNKKIVYITAVGEVDIIFPNNVTPQNDKELYQFLDNPKTFIRANNWWELKIYNEEDIEEDISEYDNIIEIIFNIIKKEIMGEM